MLWHDYTNAIPVDGGEITRQVDNLIHNAEIHKAIPLYCIYNFLNYRSLDKSNTEHLVKRNHPSKFIVPLEFSFTYVDARHVRELLNEKKKDKDGNEKNRRTFYFKELKGSPLYILFSKIYPPDNSKTITQRIYRNVELTYESLKKPNLKRGKGSSFDINNLKDAGNYVLNDLPDHIKDLQNKSPIRNIKINEKLLPSAIIITSADEDVTDKTIRELLELERPFML